MKGKRILLGVVVLLSTLLPLQSGEWRDAARGQRERAARLRERGLQVCRRHEFLDGGIFKRKEIFREDYSDRNFHWCTVTNELDGEIVNAGFAGTGLRILRAFRWQDGVKRSETWLFDEKGMWNGMEEVSNVCFSALYYLGTPGRPRRPSIRNAARPTVDASTASTWTENRLRLTTSTGNSNARSP